MIIPRVVVCPGFTVWSDYPEPEGLAALLPASGSALIVCVPVAQDAPDASETIVGHRGHYLDSREASVQGLFHRCSQPATRQSISEAVPSLSLALPSQVRRRGP